MATFLRGKKDGNATHKPKLNMPTTNANPPLTETRTCPLCGAALLSDNLTECPKCDWVREEPKNPLAGFRGRVAVCLSAVPGLGHIYKGHRLLGAIIMLGSGFAFAFCFLAGAASAGWGLLLLPLYWGAVMLHAYWTDDRALHHHTRG